MAVVSCILTTKNRPDFLRQAIKCWQAQTVCSQSELVVVDDSTAACASLVPTSANVHYLRLTKETVLGMKLNIGIERASGEIIQKLDDDDYYHPTFLETTRRALIECGSENAIAGCGTFLVLVPGSRQLRIASGPRLAGGTLCFNRTAWEACPFRAVPRAVDATFVHDHPDLLRIVLRNPELYILVRHRTNTWQHWNHVEQNQPVTVTDYFSTCPVYDRPLEQVVGSEHARFYESLCGGAREWAS